MIVKYKVEKILPYISVSNDNRDKLVILVEVLVSFLNMNAENNEWILKCAISICKDDEFVRLFKNKAVIYLIKKRINIDNTRSLELFIYNSGLCDKPDYQKFNGIYDTFSQLFKEENQGQ